MLGQKLSPGSTSWIRTSNGFVPSPVKLVGTGKSDWMRSAESQVQNYQSSNHLDFFTADELPSPKPFVSLNPESTPQALPFGKIGVLGLVSDFDLKIGKEISETVPGGNPAETKPEPKSKNKKNDDLDKLIVTLLDESTASDGSIVMGARVLSFFAGFIGKMFKGFNDSVGGHYLDPGKSFGYWARLGIFGMASTAIGARALIKTVSQDVQAAPEKIRENLSQDFLNRSSALSALTHSKLRLFSKITHDEDKVIKELFRETKINRKEGDPRLFDMDSKLTTFLMEIALQKRPSGFLWLRRWRFNRTFAKLHSRMSDLGLLNANGKIDLNPAVLKDLTAFISQLVDGKESKKDLDDLTTELGADKMKEVGAVLKRVDQTLDGVDVLKLIATLRDKGFKLDYFEGV